MCSFISSHKKGECFLTCNFCKIPPLLKTHFIVRAICLYNFCKCIARCFFCRIADRSFKEAPSLIMRDCRIVRRTITPSEDLCAQDATSLSLVSTRIPSDGKPSYNTILYVHLGRCITAMFRKFHPEHFVCAFCLKQLNKGTFKEQNDKPYCHGCFDKLFG